MIKMKVNESFEDMKKLVQSGYGELDMIVVDVRSGDTGSGSIGTIQTITEREEMGRLCDEKIGYTYAPIYMDH